MSVFDESESGDYAGPYDELADRLDRLEAASEEIGAEGDGWQDDYARQFAAESRLDGISAREHLASIAEQTRQEVLSRAGVDPTRADPARDPVEAALEMVASSIPTWKEDAPKVQEYLEQAGVDLGPVIATRDPATIAKLLYTAQVNVKLGQSNREIKQRAQTLTGSNSSSESTTAWDVIKAARGMPRFSNQ